MRGESYFGLDAVGFDFLIVDGYGATWQWHAVAVGGFAAAVAVAALPI
jgi:hypothetical protein